MENKTQIILFLCLITYILNLLKYFRNPVNFSNKNLYFISHHNICFAIEIIILICFTMFLREIAIFYLPFEKKYIYIPIIIAFLLIITYKRKPIIDKSKFVFPPRTISSGLNIILILNIICLIALITMTKNKYLTPILLGNFYFLILNYNFSACSFELPNSFNK